MLATIEAAQLRRYHAIYPHMLDQLTQMTDDDCRKIVNEKDKKESTPSVRSQALSIMLDPYIPPSFKFQGNSLVYLKAQPISSMSPRAASGLVSAVKEGYLSDNKLWRQIYREYPQIVATAKAK